VADALLAAIPNARLSVIEDVGHESFLEAPERFNQALRDFLDQVNDG
jgi:pimeloyl-ACP methyl ester carboxylesterase